ncbi:MAG: hypothetical protein COA78_23540 [Blastopirellula sp.]|nr:MAG: hypothetical protein COA78_23540 [Blastopirellula sp.]
MVPLDTSSDSLIAFDQTEVFVPASLVHQGELLPSLQEPTVSPASLAAQSNQGIAESSSKNIVKVVLNSRALLFGILLVFGPLGLPLIWFSPRFSMLSKVLVTTLTLGVTVVFPIAMTIYWADYALQPLLEAMQQANA